MQVLSVAEAGAIGERALRNIGFSADEARVIAAVLIDADLCGYPALGLPCILTIVEHAHMKLPRKPLCARRRLAELVGQVKATPREPGVEGIRIPSERAFMERERRRIEGVALERRVCDRIRAL